MDTNRLQIHDYNYIIICILPIVEKLRIISIHLGCRWSQTLSVACEVGGRFIKLRFAYICIPSESINRCPVGDNFSPGEPFRGPFCTVNV